MMKREKGTDGALIDTHCHIEQRDFNRDRDLMIERCRRELRAIVTSCSNPNDFSLTMRVVRRYKGFIYATASVHPKYVPSLREDAILAYIEELKASRKNLVAIGETGLDYSWAKGTKLRERQKKLFERFINLSQKMRLPVVIHSRGSTEDAVEILECYSAERVQMHMFTSRPLLRKVIDKGWLVSVNTTVSKSKDVRKIVRDCPIEHLILETDSPWLAIGSDGNIKPREEVRNEPTSVRLVAEKIAEIKRIDLSDVIRQTSENAENLFKLQLV